METTMIAALRGLMSRDDLRRWIALVVVCFGQLMIVLDTTIVNVALPSIQKDLGFSQANLTWVVNGYSISYGGCLGLLAGGFLTQAASWPWIFFVNVPIGVAPLIAGAILIRDDRGFGLSHGVDVAGSVLVTTAVMAVAYTIVTAPASGWTSL